MLRLALLKRRKIIPKNSDIVFKKKEKKKDCGREKDSADRP